MVHTLREGLPWVASILKAMEEGQGQPGDLELLEFHTKHLGPGRTFCALAPGAMEPLQSALKFFRDDFEQHISEKRCPGDSMATIYVDNKPYEVEAGQSLLGALLSLGSICHIFAGILPCIPWALAGSVR